MHTPYKVNYNGISTAYDIEMNIGKLKMLLMGFAGTNIIENLGKVYQ